MTLNVRPFNLIMLMILFDIDDFIFITIILSYISSLSLVFIFYVTASLRSLREAMKDLAISEGQKFTVLDPRPSVYFHHRRDGDMDYLSAIINEINDDVCILWCIGDSFSLSVALCLYIFFFFFYH